MIYLDASLKFTNQGRTALTDYEGHIRSMIEYIIFTTPGERVNRPDFGSGIYQMVFETNNTEIAATLQFLLQGALNQWLGRIIELNKVEINAIESNLEVLVSYTIIKNNQQQIATYTKSLA